MKLYSWWRSQSSFRVRIALNLKGLDAELVAVNVQDGGQFDPEYRKVNPASVLPTLIDGDGPPLVQSLAILEYLDEQYPDPPLLPGDPRGRAHARALACAFAVDAHPYIVQRVMVYLEREFRATPQARLQWIRHWLDSTTRTVEDQLAHDPRTGNFCCGDAPTLADICLVPHLASAVLLYECDLAQYPVAHRIYENCMKIDAFRRAHPSRQPGAPAPAG